MNYHHRKSGPQNEEEYAECENKHKKYYRDGKESSAYKNTNNTHHQIHKKICKKFLRPGDEIYFFLLYSLEGGKQAHCYVGN